MDKLNIPKWKEVLEYEDISYTMPDGYASAKELAKELGVSDSNIRNLIEKALSDKKLAVAYYRSASGHKSACYKIVEDK